MATTEQSNVKSNVGSNLRPLDDYWRTNSSTGLFPQKFDITNPSGGYTLGNAALNMFNPDYLSTAVNNAIPATKQVGPTVANAATLGEVGVNTGADAYYQQMADTNKYWMDRQKAFDSSFMGQASPYIKGFAGITQGLGSLANIYTGFQQLDMMRDQLDIAKDQWAETKNELNRIKGVRNRLNTQYMA